MKKFLAVASAVVALTFGTAAAQANGWGNSYNANNNQSSGLINLSPSVRTGGILSNIGVLNGSPILSGNGILSGNNTGLGILGNGNGATSNDIRTRTEYGSRNRGSGHRGRGHRRW